jgi:hypothetical protein
MDFDPELLKNQEKKEAHLRRAGKFLDWLRQPEHGYANYVYENSPDNLAKLISKLIMWALEVSMPNEQWAVFNGLFREIRDMAQTPPPKGVSEEEHYRKAVELLVSTLQAYKAHIEEIYT